MRLRRDCVSLLAPSPRRSSARRPAPTAAWNVESLEPRTLLAFGAVGPEFQVNTFTAGFQGEPSVAADANGDFVVAWDSWGQDGSGDGIYAQRYDAAGVARGGEFLVNTFTVGTQFAPSVAADAGGDFVVAWWSNGQDGSDSGVYAQRYDAAGVAQGGEFLVNTFTTGNQVVPTVAADADGDFVVAWASLGQDGSDYGVYAQRYDAAGVAQGGEFRVNTFTAGGQYYASVAADADGDFVVAWNSADQDGSFYGVYAQRYNAAGAAQGGEFRVNTFTTGNQFVPCVAADADGDFVVAWQSSDQDGSFYGVYAQRYRANDPPATVTAAYARGSSWAGDDGIAANVTFKEYLENNSLGNDVYGYRLSDGDTLPWINVNQLVLHYGGPLPTSPLPASVVIDGVRSDYTATPSVLDGQTILLTLDRPLGNLPPAPGGAGGENGERVRLAIDLFGERYALSFNVLQGDVNKSGSVLAQDFSDVKKKFFRSTNAPGPAGDTQYTPFHDVDGSGSVLANDFSEMKKRFFDALPPAPASSAAAAPLFSARRARPGVRSALADVLA